MMFGYDTEYHSDNPISLTWPSGPGFQNWDLIVKIGLDRQFVFWKNGLRQSKLVLNRTQ